MLTEMLLLETNLPSIWPYSGAFCPTHPRNERVMWCAVEMAGAGPFSSMITMA